MKNAMIYTILLSCLLSVACSSGKDEPTPQEPDKEKPVAPLKVGYALAISKFTPEKLSYAESVGVSYVEASGMTLFVNEERAFKLSDEQVIAKLTEAKNAADAAGIKIWSVHMPFSQSIDISTVNEEDRQQVVAMHKKLISFLEILKPEVILFHPSYYLGLNERDMRKSQLIKSATELDEAVQAINATMVLENMLGPELQASGGRERPLMRTVEETKEIFARLPQSIRSAIDMNHIKNPENLIRAMGSRLKTVHIADGTGAAENHYYPCSGEGKNDWSAILGALDEVGYKGPFMYESAYDDEKDLAPCYQSLYENYINSK
ncbi:sugar phosphate isomerase/epimerase family protein [Pontibacter mangrovi]|uniref:Sugar phosphate isomerase/epimerase n=1 Tax=Pontibacter mangrovi TaxID=2589816 RepID=A0A501VU12_9BACT|nr:sugar phosphate isomerase/epimerase family protein [Pontibacter mangrovi]TPE41029.1 sugar phosphate isomerase/epimerase [Pontibacter mangrovi]